MSDGGELEVVTGDEDPCGRRSGADVAGRRRRRPAAPRRGAAVVVVGTGGTSSRTPVRPSARSALVEVGVRRGDRGGDEAGGRAGARHRLGDRAARLEVDVGVAVDALPRAVGLGVEQVLEVGARHDVAEAADQVGGRRGYAVPVPGAHRRRRVRPKAATDAVERTGAVAGVTNTSVGRHGLRGQRAQRRRVRASRARRHTWAASGAATGSPAVRATMVRAVSTVCERRTARICSQASASRACGSLDQARSRARHTIGSLLVGMTEPKVSSMPRPGPERTTPPQAATSTTRRENIVGESVTELTLRLARWLL